MVSERLAGSARGRRRWWMVLIALASSVGLVAAACSGDDDGGGGGGGSVGSADDVIEARQLTDADVKAALMTYMPSGRKDDYIMFASGGQSGQVFVVGVPSMRLLRSIAVFTPEPWQGYGYGGAGNAVIEGGDGEGHQPLRWADTHHPALSETEGDYDGQYLFINDKANARVAVIDLRDFETKQLVRNPIATNDHGGTFVTPNTEYVIEGGQYAMPLGYEYAPIEDYEEKYRGMVTFWKFDREAGRIDPEQSFALELPPYWQDLCDAGKLVSEGWVFCNSINTEMATGGVEEGNPAFETGVSERDTDYWHAINLEKAEELFKAGKAEDVNGLAVLPLDVSASEGVLYFVPEPKSPHGSDVTPDGKYMVVAGKLDPHVTIYSFEKLQAAIEAGTDEKDPYGVPVLDFDAVMEAQVELGLGPLHTQFDNQGYAYTSLFLDSAVARWNLGEEGAGGEEPWSLVTKTPVHYNIGHLTAAEGDTVDPDGQYVVALNKWSIDRFFTTGPLLPQNFQLMDASQPGENFPVIYDMPMGVGEPHYAQTIKADKLKPFEYYPEIGWDPETMAVDPDAPQPGNERVERNGNTVEIWMTLIRSHMTPERIEIKKGDHVIWHVTNVEQSLDATHGFALPSYNINLSLEAGETQTIEFDALESGVFTYYCSEFCSALHLEMMGYLQIEP